MLSLDNGTNGKIDVLPSSYKTTDSSMSKLGVFWQKRLDNSLWKSGLSNDYDYVIIDTPPSLTAVTQNGLIAAQYVIIPSQMEYLSVYAMRIPIADAKEIQENSDGKRGIILGIVPMMVENVKLHNTMKSLVEKVFPDIPLLPEIKRATAVGQASHARLPISLFSEQNQGAGSVAVQFSILTQKIVNRIDHLERNSGN